jgi:hypothetical protein
VIVDLRPAKAEAGRVLPPGHPGREAIMISPDAVSEAAFDLLVPTWIRLLRLRSHPSEGN